MVTADGIFSQQLFEKTNTCDLDLEKNSYNPKQLH